MRVALGVEYDGSAYQGFQLQSGVRSVQEELERAVSQIAAAPVRIFCAGRTDAGVHATGQVVHFDYQPAKKPRTDYAWSRGVSVFLPPDIAVRWAVHVPDSFHARFSAYARTYRYIIWNGRLRPGIMSRGLSDYSGKSLDHEAMHQAAQSLLGEQDFTSFRASECQSLSPFRNVHEVSVRRLGDYVILEITANAFLHHMVRNIAGSLIRIGYGDRPVSWIRELMEAKDRTKAGATALPGGLYLVKVFYPDSFGIPSLPAGPLWLDDVRDFRS
ncbi:MAG: tRNA pseudouridine(38-40) synthase TruA [Succinivibrionaceae bacterium]|nr:tRNA pseudouridine(38-40) synthase TruA [Succinivibrionaceae bacterium]